MLAYIKEHRPRGGVSDRVSYITRLYNEEFHLVARDKFRSVADLSGKRVNFGPEDSGSYLTATTVFKALGVEVVPQTFDTETALEKLKNGEIDAMAVVAGKPAPALQSIPPKSGPLLTIDFAGPLTRPTCRRVTAKDPGLVGRGKVETIAVGSGGGGQTENRPERYERIRRFVDAFSVPSTPSPNPGRRGWKSISLPIFRAGNAISCPDWLDRNLKEPRNRRRTPRSRCPPSRLRHRAMPRRSAPPIRKRARYPWRGRRSPVMSVLRQETPGWRRSAPSGPRMPMPA